MRKLVTTAATVAALAVPLAGVSAPASARPLERADLLTRAEVVSVYPALEGADRIGGRYGLVAPAFVVRRGRLHCDRYQEFGGTSRRNAYYFSTRPRTPAISQDVARFRSIERAIAVMRHYRRYVRRCEGTHRTTDGEGGRARMKVRAWDVPRIRGGSVAWRDAFIQYGDTTWRRHVVIRTRRTVTVQEVEPPRRLGNPERAITLSRKAVRKLA